MSRKPTAWIRPLKDGRWQYFATNCYGWAYGSAATKQDAQRCVADALSPNRAPLLIEEKQPLGKWAA